MKIKNPKRVLLLGARDAGILNVVKDLTGSAPDPGESDSIAGLTHKLNIETEYYSATVPIWIDEIADAEAWKTEFLRPEAKEVVDVVGAWIFCFRSGDNQGIRSSEVHKTMESIQAVVEHHGQDYASESVMVAVAVPAAKQPAAKKPSSGLQEEAEEKCMEFGFEYIDHAATGRNEYGEKVGLERLREVLETAEWSAGDDGEDEGELDDLYFDENAADGVNVDEAEMMAEIFGTKAALQADEGVDAETEENATPSSQQATQLDDFEKLMAKLSLVRDSSADLPLAQRKRLAAKAVRELLQSD